MADIRINALATTASSTASDDFLAVDGSANGTRKLNAYSPTFGGNLTVSGTAAVGGNLTVSGTGDSSFATDNSHFLALDSGTFRIRSNGYLTAEPGQGTVLASNAYYGSNWAGSGIGSFFYLGMSGGANQSKVYLGSTFNGSPTVKLTFDTNTGNLLIGTTTDGGQKLQVNGSVNVFGGGTLIVTNAANTANIIRSSDSSGNAVDTVFKATGTTYAVQTTDTGGNLKTALTLDSSQRCILAGALRLNNAYTASVIVPTGYVTIQDSTGTTYKVAVSL